MHKQVPRTDKIEVSEMNINNLIRCNNKNCLKGLNIAGDDLYNNFLAKLNCVYLSWLLHFGIIMKFSSQVYLQFRES